MYPRYVVGVLPVGGPQYLPLVGPGGAQEPLVVEGVDDVDEVAVVVFLPHARVEGLDARRQDDGPHLYLHSFRFLVEVYRVRLAGRLADAAFAFLEIEAAVIHIRYEGDRLREVDMDGLVVRDPLVELVGVLDGAILHADGAARAFGLVHVPRFPDHRHREIPRFPLDLLHLGVGQHLYVGMPLAFDKLGGFDAHGAVVGRECLVEMRHLAADGRRFLHKVDLEPGGAEVERRLYAADTPADDHNVTEIALSFFQEFFFHVCHLTQECCARTTGLCSTKVWKACRRSGFHTFLPVAPGKRDIPVNTEKAGRKRVIDLEIWVRTRPHPRAHPAWRPPLKQKIRPQTSAPDPWRGKL